MEFKYFNPTEDPLMVGLTDELMLMLDSAREASTLIDNTPYIITSGKRTAEGNSVLKGAVPDSSHLSGMAADLLVQDQFHFFRMIVGLSKAGFKRIGYYYKQAPDNPMNLIPVHIHVDIDYDKPKEIIFSKIEQN